MHSTQDELCAWSGVGCGATAPRRGDGSGGVDGSSGAAEEWQWHELVQWASSPESGKLKPATAANATRARTQRGIIFIYPFLLYPIHDLCAPTERRASVSAPLIPAFSPEISTPRRSAARLFAPGMWLEICGPRWYCAARVQLGRPWREGRVCLWSICTWSVAKQNKPPRHDRTRR